MLDLLMDIKLLVKGKVLVANVFPVFTGYWLALFFTGQEFSENWPLFIYTMAGSTFVISGALIINNWYEVDLDEKMDRTMIRPTVTGTLPLKTVLWLGIIFSTVGFLLMAFTTFEAWIYSFLGWFVYVILYTFWSKRKYTINTIIGAVSGAFTPLIGWAALDSAAHIVPITLALILLIWQIPHTLAITIKRHDEYKAAGVPMLPVVSGIETAKRVNFVYVLSLLPLPVLLAQSLGLIYVIFAMLLNVAWIVLSAKGFTAKDDKKWAQINLVFSLNYLNLTFLVMVLITSSLFQ